MYDIYYTPKKKSSPLGVIMMILSVAVVGIALSWLYLKINEICPSAYLCGLAAVGFGLVLALVAKLFVRVFKLKNPSVIIIALIIGLSITTYFKWAIYVNNDTTSNQENIMDFIEDYFGVKVGSKNAHEYILSVMNIDGTDASDEDIAKAFGLTFDYTNLTPSEYIAKYPESASEVEGYNDDDTLWNQSGFGFLLGNSKDDIADSIEISNNMSVEEYFLDYHGEELSDFLGYPVKSTSIWKLASHPAQLWSSIKQINEEGRWSISSHRSYSYTSSLNDTSKSTVSGIALWIVWFGEILIINLAAVIMPLSQSKAPFIEFEQEWADKEKKPYFFQNDNPASLKQALEQNQMNMFMLAPFTMNLKTSAHIKLELYHSQDYSENYIVLSRGVPQQRNKGVQYSTFVKYLRVNSTFVGTLYTAFGKIPPAGCTANGAYSQYGSEASYDTASQTQQPQYSQATQATAQTAPTTSYAQPATVNADDIFGTPTVKTKSGVDLMSGAEKTPESPIQPAYQDDTNGDMDGLDTSNINLDDMYK